jgi:hypothetical protein
MFGSSQDYSDLENAITQSQQQINDYYNQALGFLSPYQQAGTQALSDFTTGLSPLKTPVTTYNQLVSGYSMSPQAQMEQQASLNQALSVGAATGMQGSGAQEKELAQYSQQITSKDLQNYINNIFKTYGGYMKGTGQIAQMGEKAGTTMGGWGMQTGKSIADLTEQLGQVQAMEKINEENQKWQGIGTLAGLTIGLLVPKK